MRKNADAPTKVVVASRRQTTSNHHDWNRKVGQNWGRGQKTQYRSSVITISSNRGGREMPTLSWSENVLSQTTTTTTIPDRQKTTNKGQVIFDVLLVRPTFVRFRPTRTTASPCPIRTHSGTFHYEYFLTSSHTAHTKVPTATVVTRNTIAGYTPEWWQ